MPARDRETVRIAYTADWHVLEVKGGAPVDQAPRLRALVDRLNAESPDLVIHGGDLVTRYDVDKQPLDDSAIRSQFESIDALLDHLIPPIAVCTGNHDVAFPVCREEWQRRFGPPGKSGTWDRAATLGPVHLLLMDGFGYYDPATGRLETCSLTTNQVGWMKEQCAASPEPWRILALHYDYSEQVLPELAELGIDCFFYGHSAAHPQEPFDRSGCRNGHLPGDAAYRMAVASPEQLDLQPPVYYDTL